MTDQIVLRVVGCGARRSMERLRSRYFLRMLGQVVLRAVKRHDWRFVSCILLAYAILGLADPVYAAEEPEVAIEVLLDSGQASEAVTAAEGLLAKRKETLGEQHAETLAAVNLLGVARLAHGDYAKAQPLLEMTLQARRNVLGVAHPAVAESLNNLGAAWYCLGDYQKAMTCLQEALKGRRAALGPSDPATLQSQANLGLAQEAQGMKDAAVESLTAAYTSLRDRLLAGQMDVPGATSVDLGRLLALQPDYPLIVMVPLARAPFQRIDKTFLEKLPKTAAVGSMLQRLGMLRDQGAAPDDEEASAKVYLTFALEALEAELGQDHMQTATARMNLAVAERWAVEGLEQGLAVCEKSLGANHPDVAVAHRNLGIVLQDRIGRLQRDDRDYAAEAGRHLDQALAIVRERLGDEHPQTADTRETLGLLRQQQGDYEAAYQQYLQVLDVRRKHFGPEHVRTALALNTLGVLLYYRGEYPAARAHLEHALRIRNDVLGETDAHTAASLNDCAAAARIEGDYVTARRYLAAALKVFLEVDGRHSYRANLVGANLGTLLLEMGDYASARRLFEQQLRSAKLDTHQRDPLINLGVLAVAEGDNAAALAFFERALALDDDNPLILNSLGVAARNLGQWDKAASCLEKALAIRLEEKDQAAAADTRISLGLLYQNTGDLAAAQQQFRQALETYREVFGTEHPRTAEAERYLGVTALAAGDFAAARQSLSQALAVRVKLSHDVLPTLSEAEALAFVATLSERDPLLKALEEMEGDHSEEAYRAVWQTRAMATRAIVARRNLAGSSPEAREVWDRLRAVRKQLAQRVLAQREPPRLILGGRRMLGSVPKAGPSPEEELQKLTAEKERLERQLAELSEPFQRQQQTFAVDIQDVMRLLPPETALVDIVCRESPQSGPSVAAKGDADAKAYYEAFVVRPTETPPGYTVAWAHLGPAEAIDEAVLRWREGIQHGGGGVDRGMRPIRPVQPMPQSETSPQQTLRQLVWEKIEAAVAGGRTMVIVPDAALTRAPWAALPGGKPGTYLLDEYAVAVVSHPQHVYGLFHGSPIADDGRLLVGGVSYDQRQEKEQSPDVLYRNGLRAGLPDTAWPDLPGTREEVRQIVQLFEPSAEIDVLEQTGASEAALRESLPKSRYVHLATHGFFAGAQRPSVLQPRPTDRQTSGRAEVPFALMRVRGQEMPQPVLTAITGRNPLILSGLVLSGANVPPPVNAWGSPIGDDGIFTAEEVVDLDLAGTELVVLSACETGLGEVAGGEGVFGLQRAFALAGARTVVASLWKVDDAATRALMVEFYKNLFQKRLGKLESMRQAQLAMLDGKLYNLPSQNGTDQTTEADESGRAALPPRLWAAFVLNGDWR